ncbi:S-adenosyl-l-methionine hydroxide adenosyltransferase family protein [Pradoshia sp. D12]|uniref:SAM hydrolase/SAM-dependent halogenase family protein n=1 Tax=Bacillaceae TaxID=186817 RepID=UPI00112B022A|nr:MULTISPECIES: S-adenosyl-l-methionine hydroxide adenosyltransferase family protein [Bacillaceae]QFK73362.1 S-adenosyl-l-methionine hydroxide adenosyltransferase family protein [Pradoshia sp. D12]TPF72159.1 DNA-directed RNA polymerase subunit delta [Bacillus sp. D12]
MKLKRLLVFQSDFGLSDGAVSAMYGVALSVDPSLKISNNTHDIPTFNIWEGSYRLLQAISYWPEGTVFVSVVDPGVGCDRRSIVAKTSGGHYVVTPDNGTLSHIKNKIGITEARVIDEKVNRLPRSGESYTFHGRDVYAYTGARIAAGVISFEEVGPEIPVDSLIELPLYEAYIHDHKITGIIEILDIRFGNLWTNISRELFRKLEISLGDKVWVQIEKDGTVRFEEEVVYGRSFADSALEEAILYVNSLDNLGLALNQKSFADTYHISTGSNWRITIRKAP